MKIRLAFDPLTNQTYENEFVALDEIGAGIGKCTVDIYDNPTIFPRFPCQMRIRLDTDAPDITTSLLGAATAYAMKYTRENQVNARVFTDCPPQNEQKMNLLADCGYINNDGLVRMRTKIESALPKVEVPFGCTIVWDRLDDSVERRYFLERYNLIFSTAYTETWVARFTQQENFMRCLIVSQMGLVGEIVGWSKDGVGVIGMVQVARRSRKSGMARTLITMMKKYFEKNGVHEVIADVRAKIPGALKMMKSSGFWQDELLLCYPGMDLTNAPRRREMAPEVYDEFAIADDGDELDRAFDDE